MRILFTILLGLLFPYLGNTQVVYSVDLSVPSPCISFLEEEAITHFEIFPNPANTLLRVHVKEDSGLFELQDLNGKRIYGSSFDSNAFEVPVSGLQVGVYLGIVYTEGRSYQTKIVIQ